MSDTGLNTFDLDFFQQIEGIVLRARMLMEGTLAGLHKSPHRGSSIEFLEHKQYSHGDEIRHIDWKLAARSERYYIKQFEDETNLRALLAVDASGSMDYGRGPAHKLAHAVRLAGALAYLFLKQSDAVGVLSQDAGGERLYVPPRSHFSHFRLIGEALRGLQGHGSNRWLDYMEELAGSFHRRSFVVVASDLLVEDPGRMERVLRILHSRSIEVLVLHILHPDELTFPFDQPALFESLEDRRKLLSDPASVRARYLAELERFQDEIRSVCLETEASYVLVDTGRPIETAVADILSSRGR